MSPDKEGYQVLLARDELEGEDSIQERAQRQNSRWPHISNLCITMLIAGIILDTLSLILIAKPTDNSTGTVDVESLPFRSTYSRLDELYLVKKQKSSSHAPLYNIPRMMTQVSMDEPNKVFPPWPELYLGIYGYVPVAARRLLVNRRMSTIMQFPVMDYGMENCSIVLDVPSKATDPGEDEAVVTFGPGTSAELDVWFLDTQKKLDYKHLSWNTKPRRSKLIGTFSVSYGNSQELPVFHCSSGSFQTIEISCHGICHVDMNVTKREAKGLFVKQYQTV